MKFFKSVLVMVVLVAASGCDDTKSVDYWKEHNDEAVKKVEDCKVKGDDSVNCRNAKEAVFKNHQKDAAVPTFN